jgi:hypothetical protein
VHQLVDLDALLADTFSIVGVPDEVPDSGGKACHKALLLKIISVNNANSAASCNVQSIPLSCKPLVSNSTCTV